MELVMEQEAPAGEVCLTPEAMDAYTAALCRHIRQTRGRPQADTVYFGGASMGCTGRCRRTSG